MCDLQQKKHKEKSHFRLMRLKRGGKKEKDKYTGPSGEWEEGQRAPLSTHPAGAVSLCAVLLVSECTVCDFGVYKAVCDQ